MNFIELLPTINIIFEIFLIITVFYLWIDRDHLEEELIKLKSKLAKVNGGEKKWKN